MATEQEVKDTIKSAKNDLQKAVDSEQAKRIKERYDKLKAKRDNLIDEIYDCRNDNTEIDNQKRNSLFEVKQMLDKEIEALNKEYTALLSSAVGNAVFDNFFGTVKN